MLEAPLFSAAGARAASLTLPAPYFDGTVHEPVLHQAVTTYRNNQRQGTAATKNRKLVSGGNQKPWRQKGTGRARQGSTRAPHWRGGGTVFGPTPRDYRTQIPAKVRQLARRSAMNARAREGAFYVVEDLALSAPKTAVLSALLAKLGLAERKVLLLTGGLKRNVYLSGRNMPALHILPWAEATAYDVLWSDVVVVERSALGDGAATQAVADDSAAPPAPKKRAPRKTAATAEAGAKASATKAPRKPAARKPAKKKETE